MTRHSALVSLLVSSLIAAAAVTVIARNDFVSSWKADGVTQIDFAGRNVAAMLIVDDTNLRVSAEEALAREIIDDQNPVRHVRERLRSTWARHPQYHPD